MTKQCQQCGEVDPPDYLEEHKGHVIIVPGHHQSCQGDCRHCPIPMQELCGPVEEVEEDG